MPTETISQTRDGSSRFSWDKYLELVKRNADFSDEIRDLLLNESARRVQPDFEKDITEDHFSDQTRWMSKLTRIRSIVKDDVVSRGHDD